LMSWCDEKCPDGQNPYVWRFSIYGKSANRKTPKNIFHKSDFYTIYDEKGQRLLDIEHGLSGLEDKFAAIRDKKIHKGKLLSRDERDYVLYFLAAMHNRTVASREYAEGEWDRVITLGDEMKNQYNEIPIEKRENIVLPGKLGRGKSYSLEELKQMVEEPVQNIMLPRILTEFELYRKMHVSFLITDDEVGFITSDDPCIWYDPEAYKRPAFYQSVGLGCQSVEVSMPISPRVTLFVSHKQLPLYLKVDKKTVDNFNHKVRFYADKYFIVNQNFKNEYWFKHMEPPK